MSLIGDLVSSAIGELLTGMLSGRSKTKARSVPSHSPLFARLWQVQGGRCAICGEPMPAHRREAPHATIWKKRRPTFDHIRPRAKGGRDEPANLQLAHAECNWRKGDRWGPRR